MMSFNRIKTIFLQDAPPGSTLTRLEMSWDIRKTFRHLMTRTYRKGDVQYLVLFTILLFSLIVAQDPPPFARFLLAIVLLLAVTIPVLKQFWLPFLPIGTWLILYFSCQFIPAEWRPSIYVRVLPALETILYGGNLSEVLSSSTNAFLDVMAWIPYGLVHFGAPVVVSILIFVFGPPSSLPVFAFAFGWMNIIGVTIQLCFPTAPPWYQVQYGLDPANYSMGGSAGGLARIDDILGFQLYGGTFGASPLVFGAFPSLHSGCAVMEALFMSYLLPKFTLFFFMYVMWIWWSTMYLTHHYFVDLIGGACLSFVVFYYVKWTCLPRIQYDKFARWSYDYIERGASAPPAKFRKSIDDESMLRSSRPEYIELPSVRQQNNTNSNSYQHLASSSISSNKSFLGHAHQSSYHHFPNSTVYPTSASPVQIASPGFPPLNRPNSIPPLITSLNPRSGTPSPSDKNAF
jgi:inositol phosphorylceramide synthase catalytic subunit